jgi:hypothetical protein
MGPALWASQSLSLSHGIECDARSADSSIPKETRRRECPFPRLTGIAGLLASGEQCAGADRPAHDNLHRERTSAASVSFHLCELRHITLPRIDVLWGLLPDCDPSPMAGSFLRSAVRRLALVFSTRCRKRTIKAGSHEDRPSDRWAAIYCSRAFLVRTRHRITPRAARRSTDRRRRGRRGLRYRRCVVRVAVAQDLLAPIGRPGQPANPTLTGGLPRVLQGPSGKTSRASALRAGANSRPMPRSRHRNGRGHQHEAQPS